MSSCCATTKTKNTATHPEFVQKLLAQHGPDAGVPVVRAQVYAFHALIAGQLEYEAHFFWPAMQAHLSPPFAGQGMNSGLRDAFQPGFGNWPQSRSGSFGHGFARETYMEERKTARRRAHSAFDEHGSHHDAEGPRCKPTLIQNAFSAHPSSCPKCRAYFAQMKYKAQALFTVGGFLDATEETEAGGGRMLPQAPW